MQAIDRIKLRVFFARVIIRNELRMFRKDMAAVCVPWLRRPVTQLATLGYALKRTYIPHDQNNRFRKVLVTAFSLVWFAAFLGVTFGDASPPSSIFVMFTAFVFALIGSVVGVEWDKIDPISISFGGGDDENGE